MVDTLLFLALFIAYQILKFSLPVSCMEYDIYEIFSSHIFERPSISNEKPRILIDGKPWISIEMLGISNHKFHNTRFFTSWIWNTRYFEQNTLYFDNLEFRLNSRYREDNYVPWLFLFVSNVWTVTKRRGAVWKIKIQILIMKL